MKIGNAIGRGVFEHWRGKPTARGLGCPSEIWQAQSLSREGRLRPAPPATLLDLHFSLRSTRRVNNHHPIDFDGQNDDISPTLGKSVTRLHHPSLRFWVLDHPSKDIWPPMLAHFSLQPPV